MDSHRESVSGGAAIVLAFSLLIFPLRWILAVMIAGMIHEMGHYLALRFLGGRLVRFRVGILGACLEAEALHGWRGIVSIFAGPASGFLLLLLAKWFPRLAICGGMQSLYNLLPVYPLDGGRALRCCFAGIPEVALCIEKIVLVLLLAMAFYGAFWLRLGLFPLIFAGVLGLRVLGEKYLAKQRYLRYNSLVKY